MTWDEGMSLKDKVHRVEELEGELSMLKADYADCNRERARWKAEAERLQAAQTKTVKFNGGRGALLCNECRKIIAEGFPR